jgi:hypothetical protein
MARITSHPMSEFHASWTATLSPLVDEPIVAVALFNPPGAVAAQAANVAGRSVGGLLGGFLGRKAAGVATAPMAGDVPAIVAAAVTASAVHLFAVETSDDALALRVVGHWLRVDRNGLRVSMSRKVMSERLTFASADGRSLELDGMFTPRSKERPYQQVVDLLVG